MSGDGGLPDEMSWPLRVPRRHRTPRPLDDDTVSRMLDGRLAPADAPPGFARVAEVLADASAPARADELRGRRVAAAGFRAGTAQPTSPRRPPMPRTLPARAVAIIAAGFIFGGVAAALTNDDTKESEAPETTTTVVSVVEGEDAPAATGEAQGPDATGAPKFGLCTAYFAGQGGEQGEKLDSTAFQALAAAAAASPGETDEARIEAFCADVLDDDASGNSASANAGGSNGTNGSNGESHDGDNDTADDASDGKSSGQSSEHRP